MQKSGKSFSLNHKKYYLFISRSLVDYWALQRDAERSPTATTFFLALYVSAFIYMEMLHCYTLFGDPTRNVGPSLKLKGDDESSSFRASPHDILHGNLDFCSPQQRATLSSLTVCGDRANTQFANFMKLEIWNVKKLVGCYASSETPNPTNLQFNSLSTIASTKLCFYLLLKGLYAAGCEWTPFESVGWTTALYFLQSWFKSHLISAQCNNFTAIISLSRLWTSGSAVSTLLHLISNNFIISSTFSD